LTPEALSGSTIYRSSKDAIAADTLCMIRNTVGVDTPSEFHNHWNNLPVKNK